MVIDANKQVPFFDTAFLHRRLWNYYYQQITNCLSVHLEWCLGSELSWKWKVVVKKMKEFVRFCIVGVIATAIHYGLYMLLIYIIHIPAEWWTNLAYTIGYVVSWGCNLWLTAHFTFKESVSMQRGIGFAVSHGVNYLLHILFLNVFLWMGVSDKWAPIPVYCLVVPINFILVRTVFKKLK